MNNSADSRRLKRIRYESSGGSMNYHSEFEIEAAEGEVIRTAYRSDHYFGRAEEEASPERRAEIDRSGLVSGEDSLTVREHIPADRALWEALAGEVGYLKEQLRPVDTEKITFRPDPGDFMLDGGDYQRLWLTWETTDGEETVRYYPPSGNRWSSVLEIIHEMSRPVGRDLRLIGETVMTEFFLKTPKYSYQITPIKGSDSYYFFVHGDSSPVSKVSREQWLTVRGFLSGLDVSGFGTGKYESKYYLRLNFNDGINKNLEADKKTAGLIRSFIRESILGE